MRKLYGLRFFMLLFAPLVGYIQWVKPLVKIESCNLPVGLDLDRQERRLYPGGSICRGVGLPQRYELDFINKYAFSAEVI
ncbi:hypothetical protein PsorP6_002426 [Peronosclerospora sorghi]|uniref:Uncharacterized protein n=1 Tax=Peronosclerospora sorghi TaxID=230839 RepID=A0ACC0WSG1_9STRA|nr:hypothetical protein PsorP6_002426 [Peronosclerospora sorghi]